MAERDGGGPAERRGRRVQTKREIIVRSVFSFTFYSRRLGEISVTLLRENRARLLFK